MSRPGAPLAVLDDDTRLDGPRIDVGVRVGWVLRTARLTGDGAGGSRLDRLSDMSAALKERGVLIGDYGERRMRAVTHLDVDRDGIETALRALARILS